MHFEWADLITPPYDVSVSVFMYPISTNKSLRSGCAPIAFKFGSGLPFEFSGDEATALAQYGERIVGRVDFESERVRPRFSLDVSAIATLTRSRAHSVRLQIDVRNLTNRFDVINFAGLFSGTAVAPPRSVAVRLSAGL